jgi:DNA-binding GntR family transcriptional regulator
LRQRDGDRAAEILVEHLGYALQAVLSTQDGGPASRSGAPADGLLCLAVLGA